MIEITREKYKQIKQLDAKQFYKSNLQGKEIKNPVLGNILFTQLGLGETFHRTKRNLRCFICLLKELVETGNCDGKLESLYKSRKDRIVGFYHIKNEIKLSFIKIFLDILIGEDQDGRKYYMFKKDPQGNLGEDLTSHREPSGSNNIIIENIEKINPIEQDFKDIKSGEEFWIGDTIKLTIMKHQIKEDYKDKIYYHGSNSKFDTFDKSKIKENKLGLMFNFTDDYGMAYQYGDNILKVKLDLNNPLTDEDFKRVLTYEEDCLLCDTMGFPKISKQRFEQEQSRNKETIGSLFDPFKMKPKFIEFLKKLGYDGIVIPEEHHYGVFEPEQIHVIKDVKEDLKNKRTQLKARQKTSATNKGMLLSQSSNNIIKENKEKIKRLTEEIKEILNEFSAWKYTSSFTNFMQKAFKDNEIFKQTHKQPKQSFIIKDGFRIISDAIVHVEHGHSLKEPDWDTIIRLLKEKKIQRSEQSLKPRFNGEPVYIYALTDGSNLYGICVEYFKNKLPLITTAFIGNESDMTNWFITNEKQNDKIKNKRASQGDGNSPSGTFKESLLGHDPNYIIYHNKEKIKSLTEEIKEILRIINEGLEELESNLYATKSVYDIRNLLKNKPKDYRIIEDNNIGYYFIGDGKDYTHYGMLFNAAESGLYADIISDELELREYFENETDAIKSFYFSADNTDKDRLADGYRYRFDYDFGYIYTRYEMLDETELGEVLGTPDDFIDIERLNNMNEELKRMKVYPKKKEILDDMEDETGMNIQEEVAGVAASGGTASFSQLGTAPTPAGCRVNGNPVEGKSVEKKDKKEKHESIMGDVSQQYSNDYNEAKKYLLELKKLSKPELINLLPHPFGQEDIDYYNKLNAVELIAKILKSKYSDAGEYLAKHMNTIQRNEEFEDITISNFNHPFIYGVDIKELQSGIYEINFVGREENSKDIIPVYIARGIIFDDGEWFTYPITTNYVMGLNKEVKDRIIKGVNNFVHHDPKFDELVRLILSKINNLDESFTEDEFKSVESILKQFINKLGFKPVTGGVGFNFKKSGNYTHILSYNKYQDSLIIDYMIFGDNEILFEKSWEPQTIEELQIIINEISNEYEGRE